MTTYDLSGTNYSESDSANSNAAPAGMPEGMAPSGVNDAWRSGMGAVKRAYDWDHAGTWATIGGTANAITLTYSVAPNAYAQGQKHAFKATASNTGATTVNINSLGAQNLFKKTAAGVAACTGGEIENGDIVEVEYDGTQFQFVGVPANVGAGGVTSVATAGLATGGTITGSGTVTVTASSKAQMQAGTDGTTVVTPGQVNQADGAAKAWVYFTVSGTTPTVQASMNVASVVRNGTGDYTISFTTAFATANYSPHAGPTSSSGRVFVANTQLAGSYRFTYANTSLTPSDEPPQVSMTFFGRQ